MRIEALRKALAARPGQPVPFDELIDSIWGAGKPANPKAALRKLVQRLRVTDQVVTEPYGYRLVPRKPGPRQLPADLPDFVGRADGIRVALGSTARVLAITGSPGVGKTSLAVHLAQRMSDRFADGQLYVNLRAFSEGEPVTAEQALSRFLRALGAEQIPVGLDAQIALYEQMTADRAVLVVIDNAGRDQICPLRPAGDRSVLIVTSRIDLPEHFQVRLGVFDDDEAHALLDNMRVRGGHHERSELIRLCGNLPLALRIAAAHLVDRHISDYLADLRGEGRLDALEIEGDAAVRATFEVSYRAQPERSQRLFRLLGQVPGPDFSIDGATALLGEDAALPLDQLVTANLVQHSGDRYSLHDLLRVYALQLGAPAPVRLYEYYLINAHAAGRMLNPELHRLGLPEVSAGLPSHGVSDMSRALAWLDTERANLVAAVLAAGDRPITWQLADAMRAYFLYHAANVVDWSMTAREGLRAAQRLGDVGAEANMHGSLGLAHWRSGRFLDALPAYERAVALARQSDDLGPLASYVGNLGIIHWELGNLAEAAGAMHEALAITRKPTTLFNLSCVLTDLGPLDEAVSYCEEALRTSVERNLTAGKAFCLHGLAIAHLFIGDFDEVARCLDEVEPLVAPELGPTFESRVLDARAFLLFEQDRTIEAEVICRRAVDVATGSEKDMAEVDARATLGAVLRRLQRLDEAVEQHERALAICRNAAFARGEVQSLTGLAADHRALGNLRQALLCATEADEIAERGGLRVRQVQVVAELAEIHLAMGSVEEAERHRLRALGLAGETGRRVWVERLRQPPAKGGSTSS
ncbi:Ni2+-binding GTPase involved in maturation of urease and hydrogenase [Lentzea atacamensis]|uniref:Ni2+-binding GTPase involved in maturation of urease and hydrogenase n=1 Tax=Lentzea atacamensis TaxID=531938 RepID=A0ABX9E537_9PSEU|nr:tetratricopeptide repeat protein [Lentzea atacamensis]RAS64176.1 Ni2+-binding GTPase involved in maturation of urease and hydrogenase [Lentzea atacamensis]